jgi:hypothetical protein
LVIKHTDDSVNQITEAPRSGIYVMKKDGSVHFDRMDTHRRAVELEEEAFFLRISKAGDYEYEGADLGILVMRGRSMTDDFKLTKRAKKWINAIKEKYSSVPIDTSKPSAPEIGGFKMM